MSKRPARAAAPRYFSSWRQAEAKAAAADALVANDAWGEVAAHVFQDLEATSAWRLVSKGCNEVWKQRVNAEWTPRCSTGNASGRLAIPRNVELILAKAHPPNLKLDELANAQGTRGGRVTLQKTWKIAAPEPWLQAIKRLAAGRLAAADPSAKTIVESSPPRRSFTLDDFRLHVNFHSGDSVFVGSANMASVSSVVLKYPFVSREMDPTPLRTVTLTQALESPYEVMECRESSEMAGPGLQYVNGLGGVWMSAYVTRADGATTCIAFEEDVAEDDDDWMDLDKDYIAFRPYPSTEVLGICRIRLQIEPSEDAHFSFGPDHPRWTEDYRREYEDEMELQMMEYDPHGWDYGYGPPGRNQLSLLKPDSAILEWGRGPRSPWIFHNEEPQTRQDEIDEAAIMVKQLMAHDWHVPA